MAAIRAHGPRRYVVVTFIFLGCIIAYTDRLPGLFDVDRWPQSACGTP